MARDVNKKTCAVYLDEDAWDELKTVAKAEGRSRSDVIQDLVDLYLSRSGLKKGGAK